MNSLETPVAIKSERDLRFKTWTRVFHSPATMVLGLAILFALAPLFLLQNPYVADYDLGFHLRTGEWILQHGTVPRVETFTSSAMGRPWVAYSWLFEILLTACMRRFDLVGVVLLGVVMRLLIALAAWDLIRRLLPRFWPAVGLTALVVGVSGLLNGPRPVLFSNLFLIVVLDAVFISEESRSARPLWFLLPLFALWANVHIQFIHGLCVLGAFALEPWLARLFGQAPRPGVSIFQRWANLGACTLATLVNPYGIGVWTLLWTFLKQPKFYDMIMEMKAADFRAGYHYVVLAMTIAAGFALGRQKHVRPALVMLFIFATEQGFRSLREMWFTALIAAVVIAVSWSESRSTASTSLTGLFGLREKFAVGICTVALIGAGARYFNLNNDLLWMGVHGSFPEVAARYVESHHLRGRIFNNYDWGGYLMWRLPENLVSIDGRANNVHDQDYVSRSRDTWNGKPGWDQDPDLNGADIVIGSTDKPLTSILLLDPKFKAVFQNKESVVFLPVR